jgi:hypothetical protein
MFCPSCGTEYTIELKYCNRCGANLGTTAMAEPIIVPVNITKSVAAIGTTMAVLTLGGFAALIAGAVALTGKGVATDPVIALVFMGMLTILISDIFLARQLSKLISASLSSSRLPKLQYLPAPAARPPAQLYQQPQSPLMQGVPSVTEHTTRFFESSPRPSSVPNDRVTSEKLDR